MFYLKKNGMEINFMESDVYTRCPGCGKEVKVDNFFELLEDDPDFDIFGTSLYCDGCAKKYREKSSYRKRINTVMENIYQLSGEALEKVYQLVTDEVDSDCLR